MALVLSYHLAWVPLRLENVNLSFPFHPLVQPLVTTQRLPEAKLLPTLGM